MLFLIKFSKVFCLSFMFLSFHLFVRFIGSRAILSGPAGGVVSVPEKLTLFEFPEL